MCKNNNKIGLFNCNRLGEITRLIHIAVTLNCNIVCKKLHWDDRKRSRKFVQALGQADNMLADRFVTGEVIRCYQDDRGAACNDLTDIGDRLFKQCGWGCQSNNESAILDQRNRAMLQFARPRMPQSGYRKFPSA